MNRLHKVLLAAATICLGAGALACGGGGNVYVGVGVVGPYGAYPGAYPGWGGRPPYRWDDDVSLAPLEGPTLEGYALSDPEVPEETQPSAR
jgi:hypothetical protein